MVCSSLLGSRLRAWIQVEGNRVIRVPGGAHTGAPPQRLAEDTRAHRMSWPVSSSGTARVCLRLLLRLPEHRTLGIMRKPFIRG